MPEVPVTEVNEAREKLIVFALKPTSLLSFVSTGVITSTKDL